MTLLGVLWILHALGVVLSRLRVHDLLVGFASQPITLPGRRQALLAPRRILGVLLPVPLADLYALLFDRERHYRRPPSAFAAIAAAITQPHHGTRANHGAAVGASVSRAS